MDNKIWGPRTVEQDLSTSNDYSQKECSCSVNGCSCKSIKTYPFTDFLEQKYNSLVKEEIGILMRDLSNRCSSFEVDANNETYTPRDLQVDSRIFIILSLINDYMELETN